jgi:hypothetical protein
MSVQIQLRNDTAANWTSENPTLAVGEVGVENDTNQFKIGDGVTAWNALEYAVAEPNTLGIIGDQTEYNPTYKVTGFGAYTINVPAGAYFVRAQAAADFIVGGQTIAQNASAMYFFDTPQTSMNILPIGSTGNVNWGVITINDAHNSWFSSCGYGNDIYLMAFRHRSNVSEVPRLYVSTTGTGSWAQTITGNVDNEFFVGGYGNGRYVLTQVGTPVVWSSTNAFHWEQQLGTGSSGGLGQPYMAEFLNGYHFIGGDGGHFRYATNGTSWTAPIDIGFVGRSIRSMAYGNGTYVVAGTEGQLVTSTNLTTWTTRNSNAVGNNLQAATFGNGLFLVAGGNQLRSSTDGVNWTLRNPATGNAIYALKFANGIFVMAGDFFVATSPSGITWTLRNNPTWWTGTYPSGYINKIDFGNGRWIMSGGNARRDQNDYRYATGLTTTSMGEAISGGSTYVSFEKKGEITTLTQ